MLANRFGMLANRFGMLANRFGMLANRFGMLANRFGSTNLAAARPPGASRVPPTASPYQTFVPQYKPSRRITNLRPASQTFRRSARPNTLLRVLTQWS